MFETNITAFEGELDSEEFSFELTPQNPAKKSSLDDYLENRSQTNRGPSPESYRENQVEDVVFECEAEVQSVGGERQKRKKLIPCLVILILMLSVAFSLLGYKYTQLQSERDRLKLTMKNEREKLAKEKKIYKENCKAISKVEKSTETEEIPLLDSKRKLEEDFEIMKKEVEEEYLKRKISWEEDLTFFKNKISIMEETNSQLHITLESTENQLRSIEHILNENIAVSNGYAYALQKIHDASQQGLFITDIQVLDLIGTTTPLNQISVIKNLLEIPVIKEEFNRQAEYYDRVGSALSKASDTIIKIGDPEIAKLFFRKYGHLIIKLERSRDRKCFSFIESHFGIATCKALDEKNFDIAKCVKECEISIVPAIKPRGYAKALQSATYHQLKRVVEEKELEMANFYLDVVSQEDRNVFLKWLRNDFKSVEDFLPDRYDPEQ